MRGHGLGKHPAGVWIPGGRKDLERLELRGGEREGWDEAREACGLSVKPDLTYMSSYREQQEASYFSFLQGRDEMMKLAFCERITKPPD